MVNTVKRKKPTHKRVDEVLVLRTCAADMTSHNGFKWPRRGKVECSDWDETPECGHGLHGLLWGDGEGSLLNWGSDAIWLVVAVPENTIVEIGRKVKFPSGRVVFCGDRIAATDYLLSHGAAARRKAVVGCSLRGGDWSTLTGGYRSTLTGGHWSTLTGGDRSTLTGGHRSTLTGGHWSTLTGGHWSTLTGGGGSTLTGGGGSTLTGGYRSTLTGGHGSTLTGGHWSTLTGGDRSTLTGGGGSTLTGGGGSTLTGGHGSTLTGGDRSTLTGGHWSTLTGGDRSTLNWKIWDGKYYRIHTVYVGENGIKPNAPYRWIVGKATEVTKQ